MGAQMTDYIIEILIKLANDASRLLVFNHPRIEAIYPARALGQQIARGYAASKMSCHAL